MDTENYCKTLGNLNKTKAIRAIHEAYLQLEAIGETVDDRESYNHYDNRPALLSLRQCLEDAGHTGFSD